MEGPINWLASYPKSGATYLRMFLLAYLQGEEFNPNNPITLGFMDTDEVRWKEIFPKDITKITQLENVLYRPAILANSLDKWFDGTLRKPCVKTHARNDHMYGVPVVPPVLNGKSLYVVRDPRDALLSLAAFFQMNVEDASHYFFHKDSVIESGLSKTVLMLCSDWQTNVESWINEDFVMTIKYENMKEMPEFYFRKAINWLNWPFDQDRFNRAIENSKFENLQKFEEKNGFESAREGSTFFREGKSGHGKEELPENIREQIETQFKSTMEKLGYI